MSSATAVTQADLGPAVERDIALDMVKRSLPFIPVILLFAGFVAGTNGALSAAYGVAIVLVNFVLAAVMLSYAARISFAALGFAALFGYLIRLGLISIAVLAVKDQAWVKLLPLGITIIVTHLGLLLWELRYIAASFAHPGLRPERAKASSAAPSSAATSSSSLLSNQSNRAASGAEE